MLVTSFESSLLGAGIVIKDEEYVKLRRFRGAPAIIVSINGEKNRLCYTGVIETGELLELFCDAFEVVDHPSLGKLELMLEEDGSDEEEEADMEEGEDEGEC